MAAAVSHAFDAGSAAMDSLRAQKSRLVTLVDSLVKDSEHRVHHLATMMQQTLAKL